MIAVIVNRLATKNVVGDYSSRLFIVCESGTYHNFNSSKDESVFYNIQAWFGKMGAVFRRYSVPISTTGVGAAVVVYFYTQTLSVHFRQYQSLMGHYKDGVMLPIESETQQLIDKVLYRVNLKVDDEARLEFITSSSQDPVHRGSFQLRTGAVIGLPASFYYHTVDDVECSSISVGQDSIDWNSAAGKELRHALVLSDKAKAFVIAREISYMKSFGVHVDTGLLTFCLLSAFVTGAVLNRKFLLTLRLKRWARFSVFSFIGTAWMFISIAVHDAIHCWYDNRVDKYAAKLRKAYAEGGVEYYNAVLRRNCALRTLLGSRGKKAYTYFGNVVSVWRNPSVQLTSRRDNLLKYLAEYGQEAEVWPPDVDNKEANTEVSL